MKHPTSHYPALKTGRRGRVAAKVREVVSIECSAALGAERHELHNNRSAITRCVFCGVDWLTLDAEVRGMS